MCLNSLFCWPSTDVHAVGLWVGAFPSEIPLKKTKFFFASGYQLEIASESGMGGHVSTPSFSSRTLAGWCRTVQTLGMLPWLLWFHMCMVLLCLEGPVSLVSSNHTDSDTLSASSSAELSDPWQKGFNGDIPFLAEFSNISHSAYCLAVCIFIYFRRNLWWWLSKTLIFESNKMTLGVILFLFYFCRTVVSVFVLGLFAM